MDNNFNVQKYLNDRPDIKFKTSGKNIGNFFGIETCVFCGCGGYHLGISKEGRVNCWQCSTHSLRDFLLKIEGTWKAVNATLKKYELEPQEVLNNIKTKENQEEKHEHIIKNYKLPSTFVDIFPNEAKEYLRDRGFDYLELVKKYGIKYSGNFGRAKYRISFPIIMDNKIVSYGARTILKDDSIMPYMYERDEDSGIHRKELLFGLNHVFSDKAILVEGIFDSVNVGFGTIALLSKWFSALQILRLKQSGIKRFFLMPDNNDPGSLKSFKKLESNLVWADEISYVEYDSEDPGCMDKKSVQLLRRMIF